ncbi:hypothetical protein [Micromonospora sp. NPDC049891]|uniref:hypothetical protein n=1 Tax=Micromonospora sp. NPDC049891 TaxID=3155655 RepID=UPI00340D0F95
MAGRAWAPDEDFFMLDTEMCEGFADNATIKPLYVRLVFAAYARANDIGHAEFEPGELSRILGEALPDGELILASRQTVYSALQQAEEFGMILPGSGVRCIVLPNGFRRGGRDRKCFWHKVGLDRRRRRPRQRP